MVVSQIIGGLGNQMFQYAAARSLAIAKNVPLRLDVTCFASYALHQGFELERIFNCEIPVATQQDIQAILGWQSCSLMQRILSRPSMAGLRRKGFVLEPHFNFWQDINLVPSNSYLVGYWQTEKYFVEVAQQIRADFTFRLPMSEPNGAVAQKISTVNAVSLHVRRGDYANNATTTATHGLCSLDYYHTAIQHIAAQVSNPHFFIFSDDIAWVKANLEMAFPCQYIDHNQGAESYNDMRLMSMCQHHIIANSSFSWWGAWLNSSINKIVVAPKKWFANETNTQDLIPQSWVRL